MNTKDTRKKWAWSMRLLLLCSSLAALSCAGHRQKPPLTQQRELEAVLRVAAYPNSETFVVLVAMQQLMANRREWDGYEYFGKLAREQPNRQVFFRTFQAIMQARVASDVALLERVSWVEDAIRKLDEGAAADPLLGRLARGLVFADLPERFGKSRQAIEDLEACLAQRTKLPLRLDRGIYRALAAAYKTAGDERRSREMLGRSGFEALRGDGIPRVLANLSVDPTDGFRFVEKQFTREADGVYVAEGYDFANLGFIVGSAFVVAIDAGTTERSARLAVAALRKVTQLPIRYVILTHGHWDHVGGLAAVREPGSIVIAQARFAEELAKSRASRAPFHYFFGTDPIPLEVKPDRLVAVPETLRDGDIELALIPAPSGETDDALFVHDKKHDLLFVGDAFMPYLGAPFVAEGSPAGYLGAIAKVNELHPRRLIHGHPPLTALFTAESMPGLGVALGALYERTEAAAREARPLADVLHDNFLPDSLRSFPKSAMPYLVARDTFVQRVYAQQAGYWQGNGEGIDQFTRGEWAAALDLLGGATDASFVRVVDELNARGDSPLALRMADIGLVRYPASAPLGAARERSLTLLRERYSQMNPFRFIVYSEMAGRRLAPVGIPDE
jgi:glyoxylase-like metal-dependent hydrolase (beta-lactamase superfamily II)